MITAIICAVWAVGALGFYLKFCTGKPTIPMEERLTFSAAWPAVGFVMAVFVVGLLLTDFDDDDQESSYD